MIPKFNNNPGHFNNCQWVIMENSPIAESSPHSDSGTKLKTRPVTGA